MPLDLDHVRIFIEQNIQLFHQKRIESIQTNKLITVLKRKNPYLFRAKNLVTASDLVKTILDAFLSSQEEGIFGGFLEQLAIFICNQVYAGRKSAAMGIDLEFDKANVTYIVAIKSGPNWGNSSQIQKMKDDFRRAKKVLGTNRTATNVVAINGCCYGRDATPDKGEYLKLCGQSFWEFISEAIKYVFLICIYKKSKDSEKLPNLNTQGEKTTVPIITHPMVAATVTSMGVIGGRYGLVSVQVEDFLLTFINSIFNSL